MKEMMLMKKRRKLTVVVLMSLWLFSFTTSAFTSPSSRTHTYYRHASVELHAIKLSEEPVIEIGDDIIEQQALVAPEASQNIVVVDGMPTSTLISAEGAILSTDQELTTATTTYRNGLITIGFITLLFASNSPILRSAWESTANAPPVLLVNAAVSIIGLIGVIATSPFLGQIVTDPSSGKAVEDSTNINDEDLAARLLGPSVIAGAELGLWKCLGTTANIYGLSQTSSDHGAFLIQLTTLIVPVAQGSWVSRFQSEYGPQLGLRWEVCLSLHRIQIKVIVHLCKAI
jgi:hypothetical protein